MIRSLLLVSAAAGALFFATAPDATSTQQQIGGPPIFGTLSAKPVLMYSLTGGTLTGTLHTQLTVYDNGFVTIGEQNNVVFPNPGLFEDVRTGSVNAQKLRRELFSAGAFDLGDQPLIVSDVPFQTVTVFSKPQGGDQKSHTFGYWLPGGDYEKVAKIIGDVLSSIPGGGGTTQ